MEQVLTPEEIREFRELRDREAIRDCVIRAANAADRLDPQMWHSAYWPEATEDHHWYVGNVHEFIDQTVPVLDEWDATSHMLGQVLIRLDNNQAYVESYFMAYCRLRNEAGVPFDIYGGGRYLDRMEKRAGEWRIAERTVHSDWVRHLNDSADWTQTMNGHTFKRGTRMPEDPFYRIFAGRGRGSLVLGHVEAASRI